MSNHIIFNIKNNLEIVSSFIEDLSIEFIPYLTIVFMLQFVNWTLEAVKLKILLPLNKLNFQHILKSIYVGNLTALLTPKRFGNFIGRKWFIKEKSDHIISATLCGNFIQLFTTILMARTHEKNTLAPILPKARQVSPLVGISS